MKTQFFFVLLLLVAMVSLASGQQRRAVFIHGFNGGSESWTSSNTPQQWVSEEIIDGFVNFSYLTEELADTALFSRVADTMKDDINTEWVIIGHSLGGLIARMAYNHIKSQPRYQHINVKAILTVGTPHQGARATGVALSNLSGYVNVKPVLDLFELRILDPLPHIHPTVAGMLNLVSPDALGHIDYAPTLLHTMYDSLASWENLSVSTNAKSLIGIDGLVIENINSPWSLQPQFRRSIIGAEKKYVPVRAASETLRVIGSTENTTRENYHNLHGFYLANFAAWEIQVELLDALTWPFKNPLAYHDRRHRDKWQRGINAIVNLDVSWGQVIDSYQIIAHTSYAWVPIGSCGGGGGGWDPEIRNDQNCLNGILYEYQSMITYTSIPEKNDVLLGPSYAVWSPGQNPNDRILNFYYDDVPTEGGYNHFELRRHRRAYKLDGVFNVGDEAPPMFEASIWLRNFVFNEI